MRPGAALRRLLSPAPVYPEMEAFVFAGFLQACLDSLGADDPEGSPPETGSPRMSDENPERAFTRSSLDGY